MQGSKLQRGVINFGVQGGVIKIFSRGVSGGVGNEKTDDLFFRKARILRTKRTQNFTSVLSNPNFTSVLKHPITKCVRAALRNFFFIALQKKKWLQGDSLFFLKKPEFCGPNAPQILQLCEALQSKASNYQMCGHRAQKISSSSHCRKRTVAR